jgi:hypothetical protein
MAIILKNRTEKGERLQATFLPEKGMNMISYKKEEIEVIDQSTQNLFEERYAGLGALIGPHFHRRSPSIISYIPDENLFPHIAAIKKKGIQDPFSHGIARYAPWNVEQTETKIIGSLSGKDQWNGVPLAALEGQNFKMRFEAELTAQGLELELSVVSDTDSLVGIHYYYFLPGGKGKVVSDVKKKYLEQGVASHIPSNWSYSDQNILSYDLKEPADFTFHPFYDPLAGKILLQTDHYQLETVYTSKSQENCWQLYHPPGASFVCIEPISSQNPHRPNLSISSLHISLKIGDALAKVDDNHIK